MREQGVRRGRKAGVTEGYEEHSRDMKRGGEEMRKVVTKVRER